MMAAAVSKNDVVIALSLGGYTQEVVESAAIARQYGAKVVAIAPPDTPLAMQADVLLGLVVRENDYIYKPSTSRYAMLAMVDVLATELAMANKRQSRDRLRRIKLALDSHRGGANRQPLGD
jgi:DNA-binding MurR/RpiR family transcriptional regulator